MLLKNNDLHAEQSQQMLNFIFTRRKRRSLLDQSFVVFSCSPGYDHNEPPIFFTTIGTFGGVISNLRYQVNILLEEAAKNYIQKYGVIVLEYELILNID